MKENDNVKDTLYSEVLDLVAAFESGFAERLRETYKASQKKLSKQASNTLSPFRYSLVCKPWSKDYIFPC